MLVYPFCFKKLILDSPEQGGMDVDYVEDEESLGGDGEFFGHNGGFGDGKGDLYESDEDNIIEDDALTSNSTYLNHLEYTHLRIVLNPIPNQ